MGVLQRAVETFDCNTSLVGVYIQGKEPLAPIGHILTSADVEITINADGIFQSARRIEKEEAKVLIPVTELSGGRSGTKAYMNPHPLCDTLKYIVAIENFYLPQLKTWMESAFSHPFLIAIFRYLDKNTIQEDLSHSNCPTAPDTFVCWRVEGFDEEPACWKNQKLHQAYTDYYLQGIASRGNKLCMVDGKFAPIALQHPKGIVAINGNAKLISANDNSGFTYRGRFTEDWQASTVSYLASQKAHNALRWLASEQGVRIGNRIYLCWNPQGKKLPQPMRGLRSTDMIPRFVPSDYRDSLRNIIWGIQHDEQLLGTESVVLTAFDAATTGRLAMVYYNEIDLNSFLQRMKNWDSECCWNYGKHGIQAPGLLQIIDCAYGIQRGGFLDTDDKIQRQHLQRLLNSKVTGGMIPTDIVQILCHRASMPQLFTETNWQRIIRTACATLQKYRYDTNRGGNEMSWDLSQKDRSFQFGRLLAVMERAEQDYYSKTQESRQTNAIKFMSEFCLHPWSVYERVNRQLHRAYLGRIMPWQTNRYEKLNGEICTILNECSASKQDLNKPLDDIYLMGYELQRNAFFTKQNETGNETEE